MPRQKSSSNIIPIENFNMGGLAFSKWSGRKNSLYKMIGFDPHSLPGVLDVEQKMTKFSSTTIDELCRVAVNSSNGSQYWFSYTSGKIWEITSGGTVQLVHTTTPAAGNAGCLGAAEYNGRIWWATQSRLHYITVANADDNDWTTDAVEDAGVFGITDSEFHPFQELNLVLYIGDGNRVAQVDDTTFSANALDIQTPYRIKSLGSIDTDLLIGTYVASNVGKTMVIRWDTFSVSFTSSDFIPEVGINAFLQADNMILVQAGLKGNIYYYDGKNLELYTKIPGNFSSSATGEVYPNSVAQKEGQILFGFSNITGNPADQLVYRLGRHSRDFDYILDAPYPISERSGGAFVVTGLSIGAILVVGSDIYVAWKNGSSYGVDKLDSTAKLDGAYLESRVMIVNREEYANFAKAAVFYSSLPANTTVDMYLDVNYAGYGSALSKVNDIDRNMIESKDEGVEFNTLQLRLKATTSSNTSPQIESAAVFLQ